MEPLRLALFSVVSLALMSTACSRANTAGVPKSETPDNPIRDAVAHVDFAKAFQLAQAGASGSAQAKFYLGRMYDQGWGVKEDASQAAQDYKAAADGGYVRAKVFLAGAYEQGRGVKRDLKMTRQLLQEASDQGDVQARYLIMMLADSQQKMTAAGEAHNKEILTAAADAGDPLASFFVGMGHAQDSATKPEERPIAGKYLLAAANSNTAFPGGIAATALLEQGTRLGVKPEDIKAVVYRYMDSGDGPLSVDYVQTCVRDKTNPVCDPPQVIKYNGGTDPATIIGRSAPSYLSSLTEAQRQEGQRLAAQWKPPQTNTMPAVPLDYFVPPLSGSAFGH